MISYRENLDILDIGSGSGILCVYYALLVKGKGGHVIGIDHMDHLVKLSIDNIKKDGKGYLLDNVDGDSILKLQG